MARHSQRGGDTVTPNGAPAHGVAPAPDGSDGGTAGGQSWYFGFENVAANNNQRLLPWQDPIHPNAPRALGEPLQNTYNFPGGAKGVLESQSFSLEGLALNDKPTLYFNYFLSTEDTNGDPMRDSFRVYGMGDDGAWELLVTNNDALEGALNEQSITCRTVPLAPRPSHGDKRESISVNSQEIKMFDCVLSLAQPAVWVMDSWVARCPSFEPCLARANRWPVVYYWRSTV